VSACSSADGQYFAAVANVSQQVYYSSNYGLTWSPFENSLEKIYTYITANANFTYLYASEGTSIHRSVNSGNTWDILVNSPSNTTCICSNSTGQRVAVGTNLSGIYTSTDSGYTFEQKSTTINVVFRSICSDSTGKYLAACGDSSFIYISSDFGAKWDSCASLLNWKSICCDSTGKYLYAVASGQGIYASYDYGVTWSLSSSIAASWTSVCSNSSGSRLTAVANSVTSIYLGSLNIIIDGLRYKLNDDFTFYVGDNRSNNQYPENLIIPDTVTFNNIVCTVTGIFQNAFNDNVGSIYQRLKSIILPTNSQFKNIFANAFRNTQISQIIIPSSVEFIGGNCFNNCDNLTSIIIPASVTTINTGAFNGCNNLSEVYFYGTTIPISTYSGGQFGSIANPATAYYVYGTNITALQGTGWFTDYVILNPPCFKEDTLILTNKGYRRIQELRKGDLVKTLLNGFLKIDMIGKKSIYHKACIEDRIKDQLYKCSHENFREVFEPLVLTGCHSILVDNYVSEEQRKKTIEVNKDAYVTDRKYRLPACVDERTTVYEIPGTYTIYHLALENPDYYMNYGIYANGLLVETSSRRYLKELSGMELID
jgi:hypothetical protein